MSRERFFDSPQFVNWMSSQTWNPLATSTARCFMIGQIILLLPRRSHPIQMHRWRSFGNSHANRLHTREFHDRHFRKIIGACAILASEHGGNSNMDARRGDRATHFTRFARSYRNNSVHRSEICDVTSES